MFGLRDIGWAFGLCAVLVLFVQCRSEWSAKAAVERDAEQGFMQAYEGSRFITGELVSKGHGSYADPLKPMIDARRFEILAERQGLTGQSIELVARQVIKLVNGTPGGEDASQEVHAKLEHKGSQWVYTLFETRDGQLVEPGADGSDGNPWARALLARQQTAEVEPAGADAAPGPPRALDGD